jgi:hypothetical protein
MNFKEWFFQEADDVYRRHRAGTYVRMPGDGDPSATDDFIRGAAVNLGHGLGASVRRLQQRSGAEAGYYTMQRWSGGHRDTKNNTIEIPVHVAKVPSFKEEDYQTQAIAQAKTAPEVIQLVQTGKLDTRFAKAVRYNNFHDPQYVMYIVTFDMSNQYASPQQPQQQSQPTTPQPSQQAATR